MRTPPVASPPPGLLAYLRAEDLEALLNLGYRQAYERGDTIYAPGERVDRAVLVEEGRLELRSPGADPPARELGAGEAFGLQALGRAYTANCTVAALDDTIALVLSSRDINRLLTQHPTTAGRLCWGIAQQLAALCQNSALGAPTSATPLEPRAARPPEGATLAVVADAQLATERRLQELAARAEGIEAARQPAAEALDALFETVNGTLGSSRRDSTLIEAARRQLAPLTGRSRLVERMRSRPPGAPARYRSLSHIYVGEPAGQDEVGLLVDAYLLNRPFAAAIRERRAVISQLLDEEIRRRATPDRVVRVLSLGCGPARTLADLLEHPGMSDLISLVCVDDDPEALVYANNLLKSRAPLADITFYQAPPLDLTPQPSVGQGYEVIASLFAADYLDDAALARVVAGTYPYLAPGGVLLAAGLSHPMPDARLLDVVFDWQPATHDPDRVRQALAATPIPPRACQVSVTPSGLTVLVRAQA